MKILEYEFSNSGWNFNKVAFQKINLIVGNSGAGKTRLLNTIFNLGTYVAQSKLGVGFNDWKLTLSAGEGTYRWYVTTNDDPTKASIKKETVYLDDRLILERNGAEVSFQETSPLKLATDQMTISLLKEEALIKPLFDGFSKILRRKFFTGAVENNSSIYAVNENTLKKIGEKKDLYEIYKSELGLNPRLFLFSTYFPEIYEKILFYFRDAFPFVDDLKILDDGNFDDINIPSHTPIFCIKEKNVNRWIRLDDFSSGMQKSLLILTDLFSLPEDSIYLIDEYENSLGTNAINLLPTVLFSEEINLQLFVTSHHPYIISKFPVENWYIAHRNGANVTFEYGDKLDDRYNISSQDKYIQLLNDPFYNEGIK